jgi:membrane protein implicated in regulation of membrane protease activity
MYIVAIAWMYVVVLMAATQPTVLSGLSTVVFYGVLPCSVVMYVLMAPSRAKKRKRQQTIETKVDDVQP